MLILQSWKATPVTILCVVNLLNALSLLKLILLDMNKNIGTVTFLQESFSRKCTQNWLLD